MKNKLLSWLFSFASVFIVRISMGVTVLLAGWGAFGEGHKKLSDEVQATAKAAAEVTADRMKDAPQQTKVAQATTALVLLLGIGFEWVKSALVSKGNRRLQGSINSLIALSPGGGLSGVRRKHGVARIKEDALPFENTCSAAEDLVVLAKRGSIPGLQQERLERARAVPIEPRNTPGKAKDGSLGKKGRNLRGIGMITALVFCFGAAGEVSAGVSLLDDADVELLPESLLVPPLEDKESWLDRGSLWAFAWYDVGDNSNGTGVRLGYNVTKEIRVRFDYLVEGLAFDEGSFQDISEATLSMRYSFFEDNQIFPYLIAGGGSASLASFEWEYLIGAGLDYEFDGGNLDGVTLFAEFLHIRTESEDFSDRNEIRAGVGIPFSALGRVFSFGTAGLWGSTPFAGISLPWNAPDVEEAGTGALPE